MLNIIILTLVTTVAVGRLLCADSSFRQRAGVSKTGSLLGFRKAENQQSRLTRLGLSAKWARSTTMFLTPRSTTETSFVKKPTLQHTALGVGLLHNQKGANRPLCSFCFSVFPFSGSAESRYVLKQKKHINPPIIYNKNNKLVYIYLLLFFYCFYCFTSYSVVLVFVYGYPCITDVVHI